MEKEKAIDFEKELEHLDEIVSKIESGVLPLDKSIELYEEGNKIIKELETALKDAEKKIAKVVEIK